MLPRSFVAHASLLGPQAALPLDTLALPFIYAYRDSTPGGLQILLALRLNKLLRVYGFSQDKQGVQQVPAAAIISLYCYSCGACSRCH